MTTCPPLALLELTPLRHLPQLLSVTHASYSPILFYILLGHGIEKASCEAFLFKIDNDNLSTLGSVRANPASSPSAVAIGDSRVLLSHTLFSFFRTRNIKKASCEAFFFLIDNDNLAVSYSPI
jgi:hypothetical protein